MFVIDDLLLATVIAVFVMMSSVMVSGLLCLLGLMVGCGSTSEIYGGGVKKPSIKKDLNTIKKVKDDIDILLKTYTNYNKIYNPIDSQIKVYGYKKPKSGIESSVD